MFEALAPLLNERPIHILFRAAQDGKVSVYIEPQKKDDKEVSAFSTPFLVTDTPQALDAGLANVLKQWISTRAAVTQSLSAALSAAEAQIKATADAAAKAANERANAKKQASGAKTFKPTTSATVIAETGSTAPPTVEAPASPSVPVAAVVSTRSASLFDD